MQRLRRMGLTELAGRGRQEASKWLERMGVVGRMADGSYTVFKRLSPGAISNGRRVYIRNDDLGKASQVLLDHFRDVGPGRFFKGAVSEDTRCFIEAEMPYAPAQAQARAEAVCQGCFDVFGYHGLFFGDPVDWHLDLISERRAPFVHWSRINPLDARMVGDSKVIWELNRHQWLIDLGQAYRFTGNERYAECFAAYVRAWMQANPPGMGINWASSLEAALRLIAWSWALLLFRSSKALSPALFAEMLGWIRTHASHVERYLSYHFSPNTHLTGEALGLFYAGVVFSELRKAGRWRALGARILVEQMERQVLPDGVYFEQSTCYHRYTVEIYLHFLILAARNGVMVPAAVGERIQRMLDFLLALTRPDGSMPQLGDADGGWLLPLVRRTSDDLRGVFSTAAAFFGRSDYAWAAGGLAPETLWLLGEQGRKAFDALRPAPPPAPSRVFPHGGYAVMRGGWERRAHHLIFDTGPLGCPVSGGHGHADLLSIQCAAFGDPYLIDPGTYCYTTDPEWRNYFRSTGAHGTVMVDGLSQAIPAGPFQWQKRPRARLRRWVSTEDFDLADADHDAYRCLPDPVVHRRRVLFAKPRYWVVVDDLDGKAEHRVELRFQFAPVEVTLSPDGWVRAQGPEGRGLLLRAFAGVALQADLLAGQLHPPQGWVSPDYGERRPAPVVTYSTVGKLPLRIVTLLFPTDGPVASFPAVSPFGADELAGLVFEGGRETVKFGEQDVFLERR